MTTDKRTDAVIAAWLDAGPTNLTAAERRAIADAAEGIEQRGSFLPQRLRMPRGMAPLAVAAAVLLVASVALLPGLQKLPMFGGPVATPIRTHAPSPAPTASSMAVGCNGNRPVVWTGPVRSDFPGMPVCFAAGHVDARDAAMDGADIVEVRVDTPNQFHWRLRLADFPPTQATDDTKGAMISYGLVVETTGDRAPDYLVGISRGVSAPGHYSVWVTHLATNTTEEQVGPPYGFPVEFGHPDERRSDDPPGAGMLFTFLGGAPWGASQGHRYYAWSSVTRGSEVLSWDYAPDDAWLTIQRP